MRARELLTLAALLAACGKPKPAPAPAPSSAPALIVETLPGGAPCPGTTLACGRYDSIDAAFGVVLAERPRVLAIGEAHAQRGAKVSSTTRRARESFVPLLRGKASDLLVELMKPPSGCAKQTEGARQQQRAVTQHQAETDQNEYVQLGEAARAAGIVPDLLRPTCDDVASIADAGADAIDLSLRTIERLTEQKLVALATRAAQSPADADKMIVSYGGALHNDAAPGPERAAWAFGPAVSRAASGRYVELDAFVPEFIEPTDSWKRQPWFSSYDRTSMGRSVVLFRTAPRAYVLVFALTDSAPPAVSSP